MYSLALTLPLIINKKGHATQYNEDRRSISFIFYTWLHRHPHICIPCSSRFICVSLEKLEVPIISVYLLFKINIDSSLVSRLFYSVPNKHLGRMSHDSFSFRENCGEEPVKHIMVTSCQAHQVTKPHPVFQCCRVHGKDPSTDPKIISSNPVVLSFGVIFQFSPRSCVSMTPLETLLTGFTDIVVPPKMRHTYKTPSRILQVEWGNVKYLEWERVNVTLPPAGCMWHSVGKHFFWVGSWNIHDVATFYYINLMLECFLEKKKFDLKKKDFLPHSHFNISNFDQLPVLSRIGSRSLDTAWWHTHSVLTKTIGCWESWKIVGPTRLFVRRERVLTRPEKVVSPVSVPWFGGRKWGRTGGRVTCPQVDKDNKGGTETSYQHVW